MLADVTLDPPMYILRAIQDTNMVIHDVAISSVDAPLLQSLSSTVEIINATYSEFNLEEGSSSSFSFSFSIFHINNMTITGGNIHSSSLIKLDEASLNAN